MPKIFDKGQRIAIASVLRNDNVFYTGGPGSGKSEVTRHIIRKLRQLKGPDSVGVVAPTGRAATIIHGITIHSFMGFGDGKGPFELLLSRSKKRKNIRERLQTIKTLVIDEISMLVPKMLQDVDSILRAVRPGGRRKPFGGVQVVFVGDYTQLPPVKGRDKDKSTIALKSRYKEGKKFKETRIKHEQIAEKANYCFETPAWKNAGLVSILLTGSYRQQDPRFAKVVHELMFNEMSPETIGILKTRCFKRPPVFEDGIEPVSLHKYNRGVDEINKRKMNNLEGKSITYTGKTWHKEGVPNSKNALELLKRENRAPYDLTLKVGAPVILVANADLKAGLSNGTNGVVTALSKKGPTVRFTTGAEFLVERHKFEIEENGAVIARLTQFPLKCAWAMTIHKSQGMSLLRVVIYLRASDNYDYGQVGVAISRARTLDGLYIVGEFEPSMVKVRDEVKQFYANLPRWDDGVEQDDDDEDEVMDGDGELIEE